MGPAVSRLAHPSRRALLAGGLSLAAATLVRSGAARAGGAKNLVVWWNAGGWDTTFVLDPHFGGEIANDPASEPATTGDIVWADAPTRPSVRTFFERYGARSVVVNGIAVDSISHDGCTRLMLTGGRTERGTDLAAIIAGETGSGLAVPYAVLSGPRYPGALGAIASDVNATFAGILKDELPTASSVGTQEARIQAWLAAEADRDLALREAAGVAAPRLRSWRDGLDRLAVIRGEAGALSSAPEGTIEEQIALCVRLLEQGLSRSVMLRAPRPLGAQWDTHSDNNQFQLIAWEDSFANLLELLQALEAAPGTTGTLLDDTLVLVASDMARSPILNASAGKDHWPYTSAVLVGGGVGGGRVLGGTNDLFVGVPVDLATGAPSDAGERITTARLLAGLLQGFDIDPERWLPGAEPLAGIFE